MPNLKLTNRRLRAGYLLLGSFIVFVLCTDEVYANAITPFIQKTFGLLVAGNAIIGVLEGLLIASIFKTTKARAISLMIAANYFSAWIGVVGLLWLSNLLKESLSCLVTVNTLRSFVWLLIFCTWVCTVILEYPFCLLILKNKEKPFRRSLSASIIAQTASYIVLLFINPPFSHFYGGSHIDFAPVAHFANNVNATVYYISSLDGDLYSIKPDGSHKKKLSVLNVSDKEVKLVAKQEPNSNLWSLYTQKESTIRHSTPTPLIGTGVTVRGFTQAADNLDPNEKTMHWKTPAFDLRQPHKENCKVSTGWLGESWLYIEYPNLEDKHDIWRNTWHTQHLQFDSFVLHWTTCNATVLPKDQVVYQLGNQIVLFDIKNKKLGLIALGHSPLVILSYDIYDAAR